MASIFGSKSKSFKTISIPPQGEPSIKQPVDINDRIMGALPSDTVKNLKLDVNPTYSVLFARSYPMEDPQCSPRTPLLPEHVHFINTITIIRKEDESRETGIIEPYSTEDNDRDTIVEVEKKAERGLGSYKPESEEEVGEELEEEEEDDPEYFDTFPTIEKLNYHE
ncbi:hypothetical protein Tco_0365813 [Tanacetum coccineum]